LSLIDDYLKKVEPSKRRALARIRSLAKKAVPGTEEAITYGIPTLKHRGKPFLGFDAHAKHIGIYPFSSRPIVALRDRLSAYGTSRGAIRVPFDRPIPERLLRQIINERLKAIRENIKP
jgi:uncharacterized protein YdhG (YjbR/CyaY superfamily)